MRKDKDKISRIKSNMLGMKYEIYHEVEGTKEYIDFLLDYQIWFDIEFFDKDADEVKDKDLDHMYIV